jgi:hypothetical protein
MIRQYKDGTTRQINSDGTMIFNSAKNTVQINLDGTRIENRADKHVTTRFPDGVLLKEFPDGEKIQVGF